MEYRRFGETDMELSTIGLGGLLARYEGVNGHPSPEQKRQIYLRADELGINLFDMGYGDEVHIPDELKGPNDDRFFSLKAGSPEADALEGFVDRHLANVRRETIDILRVHCEAYRQNEGLAERIAALKTQGKVRSLCLIRHLLADQHDYAERGPDPGADADLVIYNYVYRRNESGIETAAAAGKGVLVMKALGGQYLSWLHKTDTDWSAADRETLIELSPLGESMRHELDLVRSFTAGPWDELVDENYIRSAPNWPNGFTSVYDAAAGDLTLTFDTAVAPVPDVDGNGSSEAADVTAIEAW